MKLVIEIDEKEYNEIKENKYGVFGGHIFETIRNGRPLSEHKWIPVSERLPKHYGTYLVTVKDKDELGGGLHAVVCKYIPTNLVFRWSEQNINGGVIAWMPLPESYKESEE